MSWLFANGTVPHQTAGDVIKDHRERVALEERKRAEQRYVDLDEQRSTLNSPEVRIRTWEKVHGLRMPSDSTHPILQVIAANTRLTLEEVHEEQRARARPRSHAGT